MRLPEEPPTFDPRPAGAVGDGLASAESARLGSASGPVVVGGFAPGTMLGGRYRIVGLVGRGGMGEVYRADDLKLGQVVALKFLPEELSRDSGRLDRFFAEVRLSRQISHPNVCRVYDIGEVDGRHFLSMEFVDGEDLASLLRRIGHLPNEKALVIARQLCAGLAAAHDHDVLHRDLKPSNVMIDGRGRARITDFGLAVGAGQSVHDGFGTPAYMAPEQLAGRPASVRSDIYSLGLLLYELWTGRRAYDGASAGEIHEKKQVLPAPASAISSNIGEDVDRVLLRCLDPDPALRPASALQIARALPGADPLAAALAAGETPSPEMVAESAEKGVLARAVAVPVLAATLLLLAVESLAPAPERMLSHVRLERGPQFLAGVAADVLAPWCGPEESTFVADGFEPNVDYLTFAARTTPPANRWSALNDARPGPVTFWYRSSPVPLVATGAFGRVTPNDPPFERAGMCSARLDARGRLLAFSSVLPPSLSPASGALDWKPFFAAAGLDASAFHPVQPARAPPRFADARVAWAANTADVRLPRVEAASFGGRPVWFELTYPWSGLAAATATQFTRPAVAEFANLLVVLFGWIGGIVLARRNWRLKQGDRLGAFRVALAIAVCGIVEWTLRANHVPSLGSEWALMTRAIGDALFWAGTMWIVYLALEPSVRRRFPQVLVSWNRVLRGGFTDPLVGRDILLGVAVGVAVLIVVRAEYYAPLLAGRPTSLPTMSGLGVIGGMLPFAGYLAGTLQFALIEGLGTLVVFLILRLVLRNRWLADGLLVVALSFVVLFWDDPLWLYWPFAAFRALVWILLFTRVGVLAFTAGLFTWYLLQSPTQVDPATFYADVATATVVVVAALAVYGFLISLGTRAHRRAA